MKINFKLSEDQIDISIPVLSLTFVFIILKLLGVIHWSWWLVFSPIFIAVGFVILVIIILGIFLLIGTGY
jgi:hypothetical protein